MLREAERELSDEGGLVEPATLRRIGLRRGDDGIREPVRWPARAGAAIGAGALVLLELRLLGPTPHLASAVPAGAAALAVLVLPRLGWIAAAAGVLAWLGSEQPGTVLVLACAGAATVLLLPRAGPLWSVPALAPALGAIGLGPAFTAVAALAPTVWRRAGLGAAGAVWLIAAEVVTGRSLLYGAAKGTQARPRWEGSLTHAAAHAVYPTLSGPALLPVVLFAGFAVLLPMAVRGRSLALDVALAATWAGGLVATLHASDSLLASHVDRAAARGTLVGALAAAAFALACAHLRAGGAHVTRTAVP